MFNLLNTHCIFTEAEVIPPYVQKYVQQSNSPHIKMHLFKFQGVHVNLICSSLFLMSDSSGASLCAKSSMKIVWLSLGQSIRGVSVSLRDITRPDIILLLEKTLGSVFCITWCLNWDIVHWENNADQQALTRTLRKLYSNTKLMTTVSYDYYFFTWLLQDPDTMSNCM